MTREGSRKLSQEPEEGKGKLTAEGVESPVGLLTSALDFLSQ